eukprot:CAMPEP_0194048122 /NCGR_PEP_ID=MMETSP0009_2-20130614/26741_1 /TAXON_ID=210454 /ORGANISM="Grammatophora oceanica, Strain CCMP 410" /LENGTH=72 /DNA_ID=CAMNT_0038693935 /DNA_START=26 /DNA_END=244 /DNA_ORIENTATION=+
MIPPNKELAKTKSTEKKIVSCDSSSSLCSGSSVSNRWVCDRCGSTSFDVEETVGCEHEERSLEFVLHQDNKN